ETTEQFEHRFQVEPAQLPPGEYTNISGNVALAWGLVAAGQLAKLPVFLGSYPITPASDILHELSKRKHFGVRTVQAEDEIAAAGMALGAGLAGHIRGTTTSGPGVALHRDYHGGSRCAAEGRAHQPGGVARVAVPADLSPTRRAVDRPADQDRGSRS